MRLPIAAFIGSCNGLLLSVQPDAGAGADQSSVCILLRSQYALYAGINNTPATTNTLKTPPIGFGHATPVDIMLIIDSSGSMAQWYADKYGLDEARIVPTKEAAIKFIGNMNKDKYVLNRCSLRSSLDLYRLLLELIYDFSENILPEL